MSEVNLDRVILATSISGEKFVGLIPKELDVEEFMAEARTHDFMRLEQVRHLAVQMQPNRGPNGQVLGIQTLMSLLPIDVAEGPLEELNLRYASWFSLANKSKEVRHRLQKLILQAEKQEVASRAQAAGIQMVGANAMQQQQGGPTPGVNG